MNILKPTLSGALCSLSKTSSLIGFNNCYTLFNLTVKDTFSVFLNIQTIHKLYFSTNLWFVTIEGQQIRLYLNV